MNCIYTTLHTTTGNGITHCFNYALFTISDTKENSPLRIALN